MRLLAQTWMDLQQAGALWQLQHCQAPDVPSLPALAAAAAAAAVAAAAVAAAAAAAETEAIEAFEGVFEGGPDAVTTAESGEGVAGWRRTPGVCYPNWMEGVDAWGEASLVEVHLVEVDPSRGVVVLVGCTWGGGVGDGLEVGHPRGRAAALVGASRQEVGALALPVDALGAACLGADLLQGQ